MCLKAWTRASILHPRGTRTNRYRVLPAPGRSRFEEELEVFSTLIQASLCFIVAEGNGEMCRLHNVVLVAQFVLYKSKARFTVFTFVSEHWNAVPMRQIESPGG